MKKTEQCQGFFKKPWLKTLDNKDLFCVDR